MFLSVPTHVLVCFYIIYCLVHYRLFIVLRSVLSQITAIELILVLFTLTITHMRYYVCKFIVYSVFYPLMKLTFYPDRAPFC